MQNSMPHVALIVETSILAALGLVCSEVRPQGLSPNNPSTRDTGQQTTVQKRPSAGAFACSGGRYDRPSSRVPKLVDAPHSETFIVPRSRGFFSTRRAACTRLLKAGPLLHSGNPTCSS
jgi:hypothetical protein